MRSSAIKGFHVPTAAGSGMALFGAYQPGLELLLVNGALTFAGLWTLSVAPMRPPLAHAAPTLGASEP